MPKFELFELSNKTYWSVNSVIYSSWLFLLSILLIKNKFLNLEESLFDKITYFIMLLILGYGLVSKISGYSQTLPLRGKLDGYLIIDKEFIQIREEKFPLDTIRKIQISNRDYYGELSKVYSGNFGPALSNGTNNFIVIYFESGETKKYRFQLLENSNFSLLRPVLIHYFIKNKIDYWELAHVLDEISIEDASSLTNDIKVQAASYSDVRLRF